MTTATYDELIGIAEASIAHNLHGKEIEAAIAAHEIPHFNTPRGRMIKKADAALIAVRNSSVKPI